MSWNWSCWFLLVSLFTLYNYMYLCELILQRFPSFLHLVLQQPLSFDGLLLPRYLAGEQVQSRTDTAYHSGESDSLSLSLNTLWVFISEVRGCILCLGGVRSERVPKCDYRNTRFTFCEIKHFQILQLPTWSFEQVLTFWPSIVLILKRDL